MSFHRSKEDHVMHISKSIFVTNFPDNYEARDLWKICEGYGKVVDVFISDPKNLKLERRFAGPLVAGYRQTKVHATAGSYATAVKGNSPPFVPVTSHSSTPALMLDDSCVIERDLSKHAMGRVKDINFIPNLRTLLMDEGFPDVKLMYLGGMWVMLEFDKVETKMKLLQHTGVNSWFQVLQMRHIDFCSVMNYLFGWDIKGTP
ncbi:RNA-directed DNA polymerase, eukaryota [Tanacetum coccineum]